VSWQQVGARGQLNTGVTLPAAGGDIVALSPTVVASSWPAVGAFMLGDVLVTYTSRTLETPVGGSTPITFHGCSHDPAHNGKSFVAQHTAVVPYATAGGGDLGGWGTFARGLDRVGDLWTAGFRLEERLDGFFNGTTDLTSVDFAPFYLNADLNEDLGAAANFPGLNKTTDQTPGLLGPGAMRTSPAYDLGGYTAPGNHNEFTERGFERRIGPWVPWAAGAPTKRFLQPILFARHGATAKGSGQCYSVNLTLRWKGTPA
jgi:hypothetical protein